MVTGPAWLIDKERWQKQPELKCSREVSSEHNPFKEAVFYNQEREADEWTELLSRNEFRNPKSNSLGNEILPDLQTSGFERTREEGTGIQRTDSRYQPTYFEGGMFVEKLIWYTHVQILHLGIANTMAEIRNEFWVLRLRSKVKKIINTCNTCKDFRARPYGPTPTAMPTFRIESGNYIMPYTRGPELTLRGQWITSFQRTNSINVMCWYLPVLPREQYTLKWKRRRKQKNLRKT